MHSLESGRKMMVQILSKKLIKPSIPTPHHLRNMKTSFIDQLAPRAYMPVILFFSPDDRNLTASNMDEKCNRLERSLSESLTKYYPLAGRFIEDHHLVNCNDAGALFLEAKVDGRIDQFIHGESDDAKLLNCLLPIENETQISPVVLAIQVNKFDCGGLAIGMCNSHKVLDGASVGLFLNSWAKACRAGLNEVIISPSFDARWLFPARDASGFGTPGPKDDGRMIVTKKFVFNADVISTLRAKVSGYSNCANLEIKHPPSRVQVVTALIWKALIGVSRAKHGKLRPSLLTLSLNLRGRTAFPIPENYFGNLYRLVNARFEPHERNVKFHDLVALLDDRVRKAWEECAKAVSSEDILTMVSNSLKEIQEEINKGDADICVFSSNCKLASYEIDFGWGKPSRVSPVHKPLEIVFLTDTKHGDGVEAWVSLEEKNMHQFQQDQDILEFPSNYKVEQQVTSQAKETRTDPLRKAANNLCSRCLAHVSHPMSPKLHSHLWGWGTTNSIIVNQQGTNQWKLVDSRQGKLKNGAILKHTRRMGHCSSNVQRSPTMSLASAVKAMRRRWLI